MESEVSTGSEGDGSTKAVLPAVIQFLDHFDVALDVVVGCARKTEVTSWRRLFDVVGSPQHLFEVRLMEYLLHPLYSLVSLDVPCIWPTEDSWLISPCPAQP